MEKKLKKDLKKYNLDLLYKIKNNEINMYLSYDQYDDAFIILFVDPRSNRKELMLVNKSKNFLILDRITNKIIGYYYKDFDKRMRSENGFFDELKECWINHDIASKFLVWHSVKPYQENEEENCDDISKYTKEIPRKLIREFA